MKKKIIAPVALNALKEALSQIYWYKKDLKTFLLNCISDQKLLARINWDDYKRAIVNNIVDSMSLNQDKYQNDLINLMIETARIRDFSHLEHLDDSAEKSSVQKGCRESTLLYPKT